MTTRPTRGLTSSLGVSLLLVLLTLYSYQFPSSDHLGEVPYLLSVLEPGLFRTDFYVNEMSQWTPRSYYFGMILGLARVFGLPVAFFGSYLLAFAGYVSGAYRLGRIFSRSRLGGTVTAFLALYSWRFTLGAALPFLNTPVPQNYAMPFAVWGMCACYQRRWITGYALFGAACVFHFLVGLLPGLLFCPFLIAGSVGARNFTRSALALLFLGCGAALIYVPMKLTGATESGGLSGPEFVRLYSVIIPLHVVPSTWGKEWPNFLSLMVAGLWCLGQSPRIRRQDKTMSAAVVISALLLNVLYYLFVEVYPSALIAKLQFARATPFAQLILLAAIASFVADLARRRRYWSAALALTVPLARWGPFPLLGMLAYWRWWDRSEPGRPQAKNDAGLVVPALLALVASASSSAGDSFAVFYNQAIVRPGSFLALSLPWLLPQVVPETARRRALGWSLSALTLIAFVAGLILGRPAAFTRRVALWTVPNSDITVLATRFEQHSPLDALVLIPPQIPDFRLYSRRSIVVDFSFSFPGTDAGIRQWRERLEDVLGRPLDTSSSKHLEELFAARSGPDLCAVSRKYGAGYILTKWHAEIEGCRVFDREGPWTLFEVLPKNSSAAVPVRPTNEQHVCAPRQGNSCRPGSGVYALASSFPRRARLP